MNRHPSGCAFCWNNAYTAPFCSTQKLACPLKKAAFVHCSTPLLLIENVVVISPAIVLGTNGAAPTPADVEYVYTVPLMVAVNDPFVAL